MQNKSKYECPLCNSFLIVQPGNQVNNEGITLYCGNWNCPAQEVSGHGRNEETAFKIITEKYK